jgi:hypothetical protein
MDKPRCGCFIAPFHRAGTNPIWTRSASTRRGSASEIISSRGVHRRRCGTSGGFGCMLQMGHEWANPAATKRSAELFAAEVIPHFQGQAQLSAVEHMTKKYEAEKGG